VIKEILLSWPLWIAVTVIALGIIYRGPIRVLAARFIASIPVRKLSANQTFDLCFDFIMMLLLFCVYWATYPWQIKALFTSFACGFIVWSWRSNN